MEISGEKEPEKISNQFDDDVGNRNSSLYD